MVIPARKRWGQHFLARGETAERIVAAARLAPSDTVLEVGPGEGALTRPIAALARRVLAIEIDPWRAAALEEDSPRSPACASRAATRSRGPSARGWREAGWETPAVFLANLPYNAATPILLAAIEEPATITRAVVTLQREVARRLCARPGQDAYGYLSVRASAFARARILFDLPPGAFRPRPKVTSSVVELVPPSPAIAASLRDRAIGLASLGFRTRRKTLANALAPAGARGDGSARSRRSARTPRVRAEELSLEDYLKLAEIFP